MDSVVKFLQPYQLHPVIDHFSVALLFTAVLIDLFASAAPNRIWLRYTAVLLMILGALAAGGSYFSGGMEADRIWDALGPAAKDVLKRHAQLGEYLAIGFGVLAVWRIMIQAFGFMAGSRAIYLIVALLGIGALGYSAHLGGVLVYDYGAGTALMASAPVPSENASPAAVPTSSGPLPTVSVPTPEASASAPPPATAAPASPIASSPSPASAPTANANPSVQPSTQPSGVPSASM
jgi:uncharacterized membrane protein